jgi:alpha,alpha-trehalose-phosphate synthase [UDP-forming]
MSCNLSFHMAALSPLKKAGHAPSVFIVANRLPVEYHPVTGWLPSPGGLVRALESALRGRNVVWVGWRGSPIADVGLGQRSTRPPRIGNISVKEIPMTQLEMNHFYDGVCNAAFWPLYHESIISPMFCDKEFEVYRRINQRYADYVAYSAPKGALVWVHDYQLQLVPAFLRKVRSDLRIGFFLHVPFPSATKFDTMPWKTSVLNGLLGSELIGFQTAGSAEQFIEQACVHLPVTRNGRSIHMDEATGARPVSVDVFPVGPDLETFSTLAAAPALRVSAEGLRADFGKPELILLGVDRLDYTKGIDIRIRAVADLLKSEEFRGRKIQFIQVAVPSRSELSAYRRLRVRLEEELQSANAELAELGLCPIHYVYGALPTEKVAALYMAADVMLVTSLADGMNLVSKEFVACRDDESGRLVLSLATGAAEQLRDAWLVEPGDLDDLKRGISEAIRAGDDEARSRMRRLRQAVFGADAKRWAESFLDRLHEIR